jgi:hypothetical protein
VRASAEEGVERPPVVEDRDPQALDFDRVTPALDYVFHRAGRDESRHPTPPGLDNPKKLRLAAPRPA